MSALRAAIQANNSSLIDTTAFLQYVAASGGTQGAVFSNAGKVHVGG